MKSVSSFILLFTAVTVVADDSPPAETHQVLYLADSGVVVLQMSVLVNGQGPKQRFEAYVDSLLRTLDKNNDGVLTVEEAHGKILTAREAQQMQLVVAEGGNTTDTSPDIDPTDGKISRDELLAYFKRIGLLTFAVKFQPRTAQPDPNPNPDPAAAGGEVPLFAKLDVDGDKELSVAELQNALEVLRKLDRDDDETISAAELQPLAAAPRVANRQAMNSAPVPAIPFISLARGESLPKLIRRLVEKYDSADAAKSGVPSLSTRNRKLSRMELGLPEAEFNAYDVDADGQLDFDELRQFVSSPEPNLQITLDITTGKVDVLGKHGPEVRITADGTINLQFGVSQISVTAAPADSSPDPETLIRPLFMMVDADANGYLEKGEVPGPALLGSTFAELDADKNGKLYLNEIVDFVKPRLDLARHRVELSIVEQGRTLFDILDTDRDGRLAHREVRNVADKLNLWDANGDGSLAESEIPLQFRMVATHGALPVFGMPQGFVSGNQRGAVGARTTGPAWFNKMDRNGDGEVSRREFLGELDSFETLDLNHDGAIELTEARLVKKN